MRFESKHTAQAVGIALVVVAALLGTTTASAQRTVVFFGGLNQADLGGDAELMGDSMAAMMQNDLGGTWSSEKDKLGGLAVGAGYRLGLTPTIDIQLEATYIQRGTMFTLTGHGATGLPAEVEADVDLKLNYVEMAALIYLAPAPDSLVRPYVMAGPMFGVKTSAEMKVSADGDSASEDLDDGIAGTSFGLLGVGGLSLKVGRTTYLTFQARYLVGQTDLLENVDGTKSKDLTFVAGLELLD